MMNQKQIEMNVMIGWNTKRILAREKYQNDKNLFIELPDTKEVAYFSIKLQKVIMLPRMEGCKTALFSRRIIAFKPFAFCRYLVRDRSR